MAAKYSFSDLVKVAEVTAATASAWLKRDVLRATSDHASGRGKHRRFSFLDLVGARVAGQLHSFGLPPEKIQRAVAFMVASYVEVAKSHPKFEEIYSRVWDPKRRRPGDYVFIVISDALPGGMSLAVGTPLVPTTKSIEAGRVHFDTERYGTSFITINVRKAIEDVERITGEDLIGLF